MVLVALCCFFGILSVCLVITALWFLEIRRAVRAAEYLVAKSTETLIDVYTERVVDRAVRIVEKNFREDPKKKSLEKGRKAIEKEDAAKGVVKDVFMQNGIDPRNYNIKGMIKNSLVKLKL